MEYIKANEKQADEIFYIVQETIKEIYPNYYPMEVVKFFLQLHSKENIRQDILNGLLGVLLYNGKIIATGCFKDNHITRIYVLPNYQHRGYGSYIVKCLEEEIRIKCDKAILDASLPAARAYEKLGYKTIKHEKCKLENGVFLAYEVMEKDLYKNTTKIDYNGRKFQSISNTANAEVSDKTIFYYHQNNDILWGEYGGGEIIKGQIIGMVEKNGELEFTYQHINKNEEIRIGRCHSKPIIVDGKIELHENWKWQNGDNSDGVSIIKEI